MRDLALLAFYVLIGAWGIAVTAMLIIDILHRDTNDWISRINKERKQ